jgi:hypothetical protein
MADIGKLSGVKQSWPLKPVNSIDKKKMKNKKQNKNENSHNEEDNDDDENQHVDEYA